VVERVEQRAHGEERDQAAADDHERQHHDEDKLDQALHVVFVPLTE
jgi:hypothetical protein